MATLSHEGSLVALLSISRPRRLISSTRSRTSACCFEYKLSLEICCCAQSAARALLRICLDGLQKALNTGFSG